MKINCEHCGEPLLDGGIDYYCRNKECNWIEMRAIYTQLREQQERKEYERLKAKYGQENKHCENYGRCNCLKDHCDLGFKT